LKLARNDIQQGPRNFETIDFDTIAATVVEDYQPVAGEKGLQITMNAAGALPHVRGDAMELCRLLVLLVDNAVKYIEAGHIAVTPGRHQTTSWCLWQIPVLALRLRCSPRSATAFGELTGYVHEALAVMASASPSRRRSL
jgi:signal transduction histidine kinase